MSTTAAAAVYACACCGHRTMRDSPGSYGICPVCFWEDDAVQLRWPTYEGGANHPSLIAAQSTFAEHGAMERRFLIHVRSAQHDEPLDVGWRPIDPARDSFEEEGRSDAPWPDDLTTLYWWRPSFWRADHDGAMTAEPPPASC